MAAEIERAQRIQLDLLPSRTPQIDGLVVAQRIEFLGEVGGDYYDYMPFGDGRWAIVCGDVMGKGLAAALIMAMARSLLHDAVTPGKQPAEVLREVNDGLARDLEGQRMPTFLTLAIVAFDPAGRRVDDRRRRPQSRARAEGRQDAPAALAGRGARRAHRPDVRAGRGPHAAPGNAWRCSPTGSRRRARPSASSSASTASPRSCARRATAAWTTSSAATWREIARFREGAHPADDATLLLMEAR